MSHRDGGSLFYQLINSPGLMTNANRERDGKPIANSYQSQKNYRDWLHKAADWYKSQGIRRAEEIDAAAIQKYADHLKDEGYAASTIHSYLAPLCKSRGVSMDTISKPTRKASDYTKGSKTPVIPPPDTASGTWAGGTDVTHKPTPSELNAALGFRSSELLRLRPCDLHTTADGKMYVALDSGKGAKPQWQRVLPKYEGMVRAAFSAISGDNGGAAAAPIYRRTELGSGKNYHGQRRAMAQEALAYYTQRLAAEPEYRRELYREVADNWHHLNHRDRKDLEPLSYFDRPYALRGANRELAEVQGKAVELDRLALRAVSVLHLSHWRDGVTISNYYFDRQVQ